MAENQVLRGLLMNLSSFIGEGAGGILTKLGWVMTEFNDLVNKAETDTAWESYQRHKRDKSETVPGPSGASSSSQKRPADDADPYSLRPKRARQNETNGDSRSGDNFPLLVPLNPAVSSLGPNGLYSSGRSQEGSLLSEYTRPTNSSPMFVPPASPPNQTNQYGSSSSNGMSMPFQSSFVPPGMSMSGDMSTMSMVNNNLPPMSGPSRAAQSSTQQSEDDDDPKKMDAYKLIQCVTQLLSRCQPH